MSRKPEVYGSSIVCIGDFNPPIMSPDWLARHELIGAEDAEIALDSLSLIITHQVSQFETKWFALHCIQNQFSLSSKGAVTAAFKDLAVGIFRFLPETPITAIGLNFVAHYKLEDIDAYHMIGDTLAPKRIWNEIFADEDDHAGMASLTIQVQKLDDKKRPKSKDSRNVTIQPSGQVPQGVFLALNDHHDLGQAKDGDQVLPAERAASHADENWERTNRDALRLFDQVLTKALKK